MSEVLNNKNETMPPPTSTSSPTNIQTNQIMMLLQKQTTSNSTKSNSQLLNRQSSPSRFSDENISDEDDDNDNDVESDSDLTRMIAKAVAESSVTYSPADSPKPKLTKNTNSTTSRRNPAPNSQHVYQTPVSSREQTKIEQIHTVTSSSSTSLITQGSTSKMHNQIPNSTNTTLRHNSFSDSSSIDSTILAPITQLVNSNHIRPNQNNPRQRGCGDDLPHETTGSNITFSVDLLIDGLTSGVADWQASAANGGGGGSGGGDDGDGNGGGDGDGESKNAEKMTDSSAACFKPAFLFVHKFLTKLRSKTQDSISPLLQQFNHESKRFMVRI